MLKGFFGSLAFVHNEEGSGARYYKTSAYFPDSVSSPITASGITIDPGLDLGHADTSLINEVIKYYLAKGVLNKSQAGLLQTARNLKRKAAAEWYVNYKKHFVKAFLVPDKLAAYIMENFTAEPYWNPLLKEIPELSEIVNKNIRAAVHTALLSFSYNKGQGRAIAVAEGPVRNFQFKKLADLISIYPEKTKALQDRRKREAKLIVDSINKVDFNIVLKKINPRPLTVIPVEDKDTLIMQLKPVPPKPKIC